MGKVTKKLIIVCDEKTEIYANYLRQLISTNDDKDEEVVGIADGTVEAAVWTDKEYLANKAQISSNEHILFLGDNKVSKAESSSMIVKFDKYGMQYGWLGKRAMMKIDNEMLSPESYDDFIEFCLGYETEFEKIAMKKAKVKVEASKDEESDNNKIKGFAKKVDIKKVGEAVVAGAGVAVAGIPGALAGLSLTVGIDKAQALKNHKKMKDQQYRALTVILYIDGLQEFMEG